MSNIRKNFILEEGVAKHLEEISRVAEQSMTYIVQDMIEERYKKIKVAKRLKALGRIKAGASGLLTNKTVQSIKSEQRV
jgi:hypothetical protein